MYKICNGLLPEVINVLYVSNKDIHSYNTRSSNLLRVPKGSTNFVNTSTRLWNVLLVNIDVNVSISTFKHNLKTYLLHNNNNNICLKSNIQTSSVDCAPRELTHACSYC